MNNYWYPESFKPTFKSLLPVDNVGWRLIRKHFDDKCALTGSTDIQKDHFIPYTWGHGGSYHGNLIPLNSKLNAQKSNKNPFEWFERTRVRNNLSVDSWDHLISVLAEANGMDVTEFKDFVYWCESNKRTVTDLSKDKTHSILLWEQNLTATFT